MHATYNYSYLLTTLVLRQEVRATSTVWISPILRRGTCLQHMGSLSFDFTQNQAMKQLMEVMCAALTFQAVVSPGLCFLFHFYMPSAGLFHCQWLLLWDLH